MTTSRTATIELSRDYYSEVFDQVTRYGSRKRIIEWIVGASSIVLFAILLFANRESGLLFVFAALAGATLLGSPIQKRFWLHGRNSGKRAGETVKLVFEEAGFLSEGPFSSGRFSWQGIEKHVRTPKGLALWLEKGIVLYLPESQVDRATIDFVQSKLT